MKPRPNGRSRKTSRRQLERDLQEQRQENHLLRGVVLAKLREEVRALEAETGEAAAGKLDVWHIDKAHMPAAADGEGFTMQLRGRRYIVLTYVPGSEGEVVEFGEGHPVQMPTGEPVG